MTNLWSRLTILKLQVKQRWSTFCRYAHILIMCVIFASSMFLNRGSKSSMTFRSMLLFLLWTKVPGNESSNYGTFEFCPSVCLFITYRLSTRRWKGKRAKIAVFSSLGQRSGFFSVAICVALSRPVKTAGCKTLLSSQYVLIHSLTPSTDWPHFSSICDYCWRCP